MTLRSFSKLTLFITCLFCLVLVSCGGQKGTDATTTIPPGSLPEPTQPDAGNEPTEEPSNTINIPEPLHTSDSARSTFSTADNTDKKTCGINSELPSDVPQDADAETLHALGQDRILAKDGASAVAILKKAHDKNPKKAQILGDLSTALLQCKLYDQAIERIKQAAALAPNDVDIAANLAQVYQIAGRLQEAVNAYREALSVDPKDAAIHNNLAVLLVLTNLDGAEDSARSAVNLEPENVAYLVNLGYILFRKKRLVDAEMVLRRALETAPKNANALNQLGLILAAQKREPQATECFRKALNSNPNHRAARENLEAMDRGLDFIGPWDAN